MIDKSKTYRTRNGLEARIYATDGANGKVHGAILDEGGWEHRTWNSTGRIMACEAHIYDLIEVRPRHKVLVWINTYGATVSGGLYSTRESADEAAISRRTGCIKVELDFEEGEGL